MKAIVGWAGWLALAAFAAVVHIDAIASSGFGPDVEVRFLTEPSGVIEPGTEGVLYIAAVNHGDVAIEPWMTFSKQLDGADYFLGFFADSETAPCTYSYYTLDGLPGNPSFDGIQLVPGVVGPGQSVTCRVRFRVGAEASGAVQVEVSALPGFDDGIDPDYSNNLIQTAIIVRSGTTGPVPVPVVIPVWREEAALLLALLVAFAGALRYVRR